MTKLADSKNIIARLQELVVKEAQAGTATGVPGKDTNYVAISNEHDKVDKNKVKPETLAPQAHEQHVSTDANAPVKAAESTEVPAVVAEPVAPVAAEPATKTASELGQELLTLIEKAAKAGTATGVPGKDTNYVAISNEHDKVDKNKVKPETLAPQAHEQHVSTDSNAPVKAAATVDLDKLASYSLGVSLAKMHMKQAADQELALCKEAGRREFEQLITKASQELQAQAAAKVKTAALEKEAEVAGANYFHSLVKQAKEAQVETVAVKQAEDTTSKLDTKLAELQAEVASLKKAAADRDAELQKQAAERKEMEKFAALADFVSNNVFERLKNEIVKQPNA